MKPLHSRNPWFITLATLLMLGLSVTARAANLPDFSSLVEKNSAAVVNISTTQKVKSSLPGMPHGFEMPDMPDMPEGTPFGDLFKHFFGEGGPGQREFDAKSLGSGFIISEDGYVMTNNHVVKDADEIIVRLSDRRQLVAEVIGTDERSDVALLKINADKLPVAKI